MSTKQDGYVRRIYCLCYKEQSKKKQKKQRQTWPENIMRLVLYSKKGLTSLGDGYVRRINCMLLGVKSEFESQIFYGF